MARGCRSSLAVMLPALQAEDPFGIVAHLYYVVLKRA
jgi:hypothetical protein